MRRDGLDPSPGEVARRLRRAYGRPARPSQGDIVGGLVSTMLSQNTSGTNANRAYSDLRKRFPRWDLLVESRVEDIEAAISVAGFGAIRSKNIQATLRILARDDPSFRLDFLREMPTPAVLDYLLALPGVGPKTAACVALFELDRPVFPVDTHIVRIAGRLGWVEIGEKAERAQAFLGPRIPARLRLELHLNMISHGRKACVAGAPRCSGCCLGDICEFVHIDPLTRGGEVATV